MDDCPIVHVSENLQRLTGYSRHEVIGKNCLFFQAPSGNVEAGSKREFTDDSTLYHLKKMIHQGLEVQQSIVNYRKDGKPFLNLLTLIPISWDAKDIHYFIGFQVDIVECPDTKSSQEWDNLNISYILSHISQSIWTLTTSGQWGLERGQTLDIDDGSTLFPNPHPEGPVSDPHGQLCNKMLFGTTGHVVHVLSLKGIFLYLSPAWKQVLEYRVTELVGLSLSFVCHPSLRMCEGHIYIIDPQYLSQRVGT
jgi:PAS domain S-box-containing protein